MRKVLLFLILLGVGLAILLFLRGRNAHPPTPAPGHLAPPRTEEFTEMPTTPDSGGKQGSIGIVARGHFEGTAYDREGASRKPVYHVTIGNTEPLGEGAYALHDLVLDVFDPATGEISVKLLSPLSRAKIVTTGGAVALGDGNRVILSDVTATLYRGGPIVPLTIRSPILMCDLATRHFESDKHVVVTGVGLEAESAGLSADDATSTLVLKREGTITLALPDGTKTTLAATGDGPVTVKRADASGESRIELMVTGGGRLSATGDEVPKLDGQMITLVARGGGDQKDFDLVSADAQGDVVAVSRGDTFRASTAHFDLGPGGRILKSDLRDSVVLQSGDNTAHARHATFEFGASGILASAHIDGDVVLDHGADQFHADLAVFEFDAAGKLARAVLTGAPRGAVAVGQYVPAGQRELHAANARISGAGPLVLGFPGATQFQMTGPGRIEIPELEFVLEAARDLSGEATADPKGGTLRADGEVRAKFHGDALATDSLKAVFSTSATGEQVIDATSTGRTKLDRSASAPGDRGPVGVLAEGGMEVRSTGEHLVVRTAHDIVATATGAGQFTARAATLRDFDWDARTFVAEGNVVYEDAQGGGSAEGAIARGPGDVELLGTPQHRARYAAWTGAGADRHETASVEAQTIRARSDGFDAHQDVTAILESDRRYRLDGGHLHVEFEAAPSGDPQSPRRFHARAEEAVRARIESEKGASTLACDRLFVDGVAQGTARTPGPAPAPGPALAQVPVEASSVRAEGSVDADWRVEGGVAGKGDLFTLSPAGLGRLSADPGKRVSATGRLAPDSETFTWDADWIEFEKNRVEARQVEMHAIPPEVEPQGPLVPPTALKELRAEKLVATKESLDLEGAAHAKGATPQGDEWWIDAHKLHIDAPLSQRGLSIEDIRLIEATGGFEAEIGVRGHMKGERLQGKLGKLRLEGNLAQLDLGSTGCRSAWIEYDMRNMLLASDKGEIARVGTGDVLAWKLAYDSLQPFDRDDKTILALRNPVFTDDEMDIEMRAQWMLVWVDRNEWRKNGLMAIRESTTGPELHVQAPDAGVKPGAPRPAKKKKKQSMQESFRLLKEIQTGPNAKVLNEIYLEGDVEIVREGQRARATSIYLDILDGHGWVRDADLIKQTRFRDNPQGMHVKAEWLRVSSDGTFRADHAVITTCDYDQPHYVIETGDLKLRASADRVLDWDLSATKNELRFENGWSIPLPPLVYGETDSSPFVENLSMGKSAKYGAAVGATFNLAVSKKVTAFFAGLMDVPPDDMHGHLRFPETWLGSRGLLMGLGLTLRSAEKFKLDLDLSAIPDSGEDRGEVRVPEGDRGMWRTWARARGRLVTGQDEWFDLALSVQSDPGVQSEFFPHDYNDYEQKDNYLHWRKAVGSNYFDASLKVRFEDRTDVEELPSVGWFRSRTEIGHIGTLPMLWTGSVDLDNLRRREGDPNYYPPFQDGLGDRDVKRVDVLQKIETPFPLGFADLRLTPYVAGRVTAWDEGANSSTSPTRVATFAGADLSTTVWKRYANGTIHTIEPTIGVHEDLSVTQSTGGLVEIDRVENSQEGQFVDFGLRTRVWNPASRSRFDLDVHTAHAEDLANGAPEGIQPVQVLAEFYTMVGSLPVGLTHDGQYSTDDGNTLYSRSFLGLQPWDRLDVELGYHEGRDAVETVIYEAASMTMRYRATLKWELEFGQTVSLLDNGRLSDSFLLRRIGHDFVMEAEVGYQAGEGARFGINLIPMLTWHRHSIGLLDTYTGAYR